MNLPFERLSRAIITSSKNPLTTSSRCSNPKVSESNRGDVLLLLKGFEQLSSSIGRQAITAQNPRLCGPELRKMMCERFNVNIIGDYFNASFSVLCLSLTVSLCVTVGVVHSPENFTKHYLQKARL